MNKRYILALLALSTVWGIHAQKIDFNKPGRNEQVSTETGFSPWAVTDTQEAVATFDGITLTISCDPQYAGGYVSGNYWKDGVESKGYKLIGDGLVGYQNGHDQVTSGAVKIDVKISGLAPGTHTLQAFHNNFEGLQAPDIEVLVNGTVVKTGIKQTNRDISVVTCGQSFVEFQVVDGEPVTVSYLSKPAQGTSYGTTSVTINALAFDVADNLNTAQEPYPANTDFHVDADDGYVVLSWVPAATAVKHHVMFGTSEDDLNEVACVATDSHTVSGLSSMNTYYWRIDEENAVGEINKGTVWSFRPRHLAFPGAEGYGKYAIGGRGGTVYHVTNLEDNGDDNNPIAGSFRYGIKKVSGPRTIVFDVSGTIHLKSRLTCGDKYVTIAGQTAPGAGIMLRGAPFGMGSDGITRFLRSRRGQISDQDPEGIGLDGLGMAGNDHSIMDHCSVSWTIDEAFSSRGAKNLTLQHSLISEALNVAGHPNYSDGTAHGYAATIGGGEMGGICGSYHHNLLAHCEGRNWSISGGLDGAGYYDGHHDVYNNVVYNWGGRATDGGTHEMNFVNNYYKMGPATSQSTLMNLQLEGTGKGTQSVYVSGNIRQEKNNGKLTEDKRGTTYKYNTSGGQVVDWNPLPTTPFAFFNPEGNAETARAAFKNVLSDAGCNLPLIDNHDRRMVSETLTGTSTTKGSRSGKKGLIDSEEDNGCEGFDMEKLGITSESRPSDWDHDQDGMPDWFEELTGTNPYDADNNEDPDGDGYTNLEDYLNWIAAPNYQLAESTEISLSPWFAGYTQPSYTIATGSHAAIDGDKLTVVPTGHEKMFTITVTATEDGISLTREFHFACTRGATGIHELRDSVKPSSGWYNLNGQPVASPRQGVYIRNGKKIMR